MSCDKYSSAWYPFFELIKKYWPQHPQLIILSTETKSYTHDGLNIQCSNTSPTTQWSDRLIQALSLIQTKYVVFSLEDFFLQAPVKHEIVIQCYEYMERNPMVAQCRFKNCDNSEQISKLTNSVMPDFYSASSDVIYRLDTQIALWKTDWLRDFVVTNENPWQFETIGTQRIKYTEAQFIWYHSKEKPTDTAKLLFPYQMALSSGYGISMGHWLWNNKKLFLRNGLIVDFSELGIISRFQVNYNLFVNRAIYQKDPRLIYRFFSIVYRMVRKIYNFFVF